MEIPNLWPSNKADLLMLIAADWQKLEQLMSRFAPAGLNEPDPTTGWTVKDHLAHLAAWEGGIAWLLSGRPRPAGMGVDSDTYYHKTMDDLNEWIYQQNRQRPQAEIVAHFQATHQQLLQALADLQDEDLARPYSHYQPDEPGRDDGRPIVRLIVANTYEHYQEHFDWFEQLLK